MIQQAVVEGGQAKDRFEVKLKVISISRKHWQTCVLNIPGVWFLVDEELSYPTGFVRPQMRPFWGLRYSLTSSDKVENLRCCKPFKVYKKQIIQSKI